MHVPNDNELNLILPFKLNSNSLTSFSCFSFPAAVFSLPSSNKFSSLYFKTPSCMKLISFPEFFQSIVLF